MIKLDIKITRNDIGRKLTAMVREQIPFATAMALNATAEQVRIAQQANMRAVLDSPTPFTQNAVAVRKATKKSLVAVVYVKPIAAAYLEPYEVGGLNKLNGRALLKPVNAKINQYGNLPRNLIRNALGRGTVFAGKVNTKAGVVDGVWQRTKKTRGKRAGLKLLVRFEDAHPIRQRLNYQAVARRTASVVFKSEMAKALAQAIATAK